MISTIIRLILTLIIIIFMWLDYKWALYVSVTGLAISNEIVSYLVIKHIKDYNIHNKNNM